MNAMVIHMGCPGPKRRARTSASAAGGAHHQAGARPRRHVARGAIAGLQVDQIQFLFATSQLKTRELYRLHEHR